MRTSQLFRTFIATLLIAAGLWYSGFGTAGRVAADAGSPQQSRVTTSDRQPTSASDLMARRTNRCAVRDPLAYRQVAIEEEINRKGAKQDGSLVTIPVYWHVVTTAAGGGDIRPLIPAQMDVLNNAYSASGFMFQVERVRVIANNDWFFATVGSAAEAQMKATLRGGGPDSLNIYTTNGDIYLGWSTLPFDYKFFPSYDGVVLFFATLPGTNLEFPFDEEPDGLISYNLGDTGTHEVGHWLGLDHTFAGGCSHPGDHIKDTPAEAEPQFLCVPRDSCVGPQFRGVDPITNFMDYVDDVCMVEFTSDQSKRMRKQWHAFRDKKARN
jgi:pregnancy-associated plasma protein-A